MFTFWKNRMTVFESRILGEKAGLWDRRVWGEGLFYKGNGRCKRQCILIL